MRNLKIKYKGLFVILIVLVLFGCSTDTKHFKGKYITYTYTHVTDEEDKFMMDTYFYNCETGDNKLISQIPYQAQYPLTYYDYKRNAVFHTKRVGKSHYDEVYQYDCRTTEEKKLTNGVYAVNAMFKVNDHELALVAVTDSKIIHLCFLDLDTLKLEEKKYKNESIKAQFFDEKNNTILLACLDEEKSYQLMDDFNNGKIGPYKEDFTFYEYSLDTKEYKELFHDKDNGDSIPTIIGDEKNIYYRIDDHGSSKVMKYDRKTKKTEEFLDKGEMYRQFILLDDDEKTLIFDNGGYTLMEKNLETGEAKDLFHTDAEGALNNGFAGDL